MKLQEQPWESLVPLACRHWTGIYLQQGGGLVPTSVLKLWMKIYLKMGLRALWRWWLDPWRAGRGENAHCSGQCCCQPTLDTLVLEFSDPGLDLISLASGRKSILASSNFWSHLLKFTWSCFRGFWSHSKVTKDIPQLWCGDPLLLCKFLKGWGLTRSYTWTDMMDVDLSH